MDVDDAPTAYICPITHDVMEEPYIDNEGVSYERSAIMGWLARGGTTSPATNRRLTPEQLRPNLALRGLIEQWRRDHLHSTAGSGSEADNGALAAAAPPPPPRLTPEDVALVQDGASGLTFLTAPEAPEETAARTPVHLVAVLDTSGSMSTEAQTRATDGATEVLPYSVLDIAKHAVRALVRMLRPQDRLSLVAYSSEARTPVRFTADVARVDSALDALDTDGMTNFAAAVRAALEAALPHTATHDTQIMMLTDGCSTLGAPMLPVLDALCRARGLDLARDRVVLNTCVFGYGLNVDSASMLQLAARGGGCMYYVPDIGMMGTAFVHLAANAFATAVPADGRVYGGLLYGESRLAAGDGGLDLVAFPLKATAAVARDAYARACMLPRDPDAPPRAALPLLARAVALAALAFDAVSDLPLTEADLVPGGARVAPEDTAARDALLRDVREQVLPGLADPEHRQRWGQHYVRAWAMSHLRARRINFKDASGESYAAGAAFAAEHARCDDVFNLMDPPPVLQHMRERAARLAAAPRAAGAAPVRTLHLSSMAAINDRDGGCVSHDSLARMADGSRCAAGDIMPGDRVALADGGTAAVALVMVTVAVDKPLVLFDVDNGAVRLTAWHPVRPQAHAALGRAGFALASMAEGAWPAGVVPPLGRAAARLDAATGRMHPHAPIPPAHCVYSFALRDVSPDASLQAMVFGEGTAVICLAHGHAEPPLYHPLFGTAEVLRQLGALAGGETRDVVLYLRDDFIAKDATSGLAARVDPAYHLRTVHCIPE